MYPSLVRYWGQSLEAQTDVEKAEEKRGFDRNGFNQFISDRLPLDREVPDTRDPRCVQYVANSTMFAKMW